MRFLVTRFIVEDREKRWTEIKPVLLEFKED